MKITEDYCSFELSNLLKEKGFNCVTDMYYSPEGKLCCWMPNNLKSHLDNLGAETWWWKCVAPTIQLACKWLRIKHNLCVIPIMTSKVIREKYGCWEADIYYYEGEFAGIDEL